MKVGDEKTVKVSFPDEYPVENLAEFAVTVKEVKVPRPRSTTSARSLGLESLDKLKELMQGQAEQELQRPDAPMKGKLLDQLAASYDDAPTMVEAEFGQDLRSSSNMKSQ